MKEFIISKNDSGQRIDKFLTKALKRLPKTLMYKYIRLKRIKINGKRCEISTRLNENDIVSLYINDEFFENDSKTEFKSAGNDLDIVYEDQNIMLLNKPAGLVVHEDNENTVDTLLNRMLKYLNAKGEYDPESELSFTPSLCNRIDRNTCGIVICAKNSEALRIMNQKIKNREIEKKYLCAVHGTPFPSQAVLKHYLKKNELDKKVFVDKHPFSGAKTAVTAYKTIKSKNGISLLEIDLKTGRTHQIRAVMAYMGYPLVGDGKYGKAETDKRIRYQALCSQSLTFKFRSDAGILNYLNHKNYYINDIWFIKLLGFDN